VPILDLEDQRQYFSITSISGASDLRYNSLFLKTVAGKWLLIINVIFVSFFSFGNQIRGVRLVCHGRHSDLRLAVTETKRGWSTFDKSL